MRIAIVGASGFIGSLCAGRLSTRADVIAVEPPRVSTHAQTIDSLLASARGHEAIGEIAELVRGADAVVNAAGMASPDSALESGLLGANALLPVLISQASADAGASRLVHVSSAAVQGRNRLDESEHMAPLSPYSFTKALGEAALRAASPIETVRYRPTSVHGATRATTAKLARLARSQFSAVAAPGSDPTPQIHVDNVADAVAFLAMTDLEVPPVALHPWEGFSTSSFLETLGGHPPRKMTRRSAQAAVATLSAAANIRPSSVGAARRVEMLLLGQKQSESWLTAAGWKPPATASAWEDMAGQLAMAAVEDAS